MSKTIGANYRLTRFLDNDEIEELKRAVRECWEELHADPDWSNGARSPK